MGVDEQIAELTQKMLRRKFYIDPVQRVADAGEAKGCCRRISNT